MFKQYIVNKCGESDCVLHESFSCIVKYFEGYQLSHVDKHIASLISLYPYIIVGRKFSGLVTGFSLKNVSSSIMKSLGTLRGVETVSFSKRFHTTNMKSWGQDRLDQSSLPLDNRYRPSFDGSGVNVFVVDTGLDTSHAEFRSNPLSPRVVKNIFDVNQRHPHRSSKLDIDNDQVGHGTHVAGTIGGLNTGLSPGANIYGIKVLDETGGGEDEDVLDGLDFIHNWYNSNNAPPTVVSMSLGGECLSVEDCESDVVIQAVEKLVAAGITVVAAAGNDDCDSCLNTPAFSMKVITVGATNIEDKAAIFSDFGKCVDVYAPGENITSACAKSMCHVSDSYIELSGTSMACPHVTGVVAQLLQVAPMASPDQVLNMLSCSAVRGKLEMLNDKSPSVTRNLLLQVPRPQNATLATLSCDLGLGCSSGCSNNGLCQDGECVCGRSYWGRNCSVTEFGKHCDDDFIFLPYTLSDSSSNSWQGSEMRISFKNNPSKNSSVAFAEVSSIKGGGMNVDKQTVLTTSMCVGDKETSGVCLAPGVEYTLKLTAGPKAVSDVGWSMCGVTGGAPYLLDFHVKSDGSCELLCPGGELVDMSLTSTSASGWGPGHYELFSLADGVVVAGGSLGRPGEQSHKACLPHGVSAAVFSGDSASSAVRRSRWSICGASGRLGHDYFMFRVHGNLSSPAEEQEANRAASSGANLVCERIPRSPVAGCSDAVLALGTFDVSLKGWKDFAYSVESMDWNTAGRSIGSDTLRVGVAGEEHQHCLQTLQNNISVGEWRLGSSSDLSNYDLQEAGGYASTTGDSNASQSSVLTRGMDKNAYWVSCGKRGDLGEFYRFERSFDNSTDHHCRQQCQQLRSLSPLPEDESLRYLVSASNIPRSLVSIHSIEDELSPVCLGNATVVNATTCYHVILGGGTLTYGPQWQFCGLTVPSTAAVDVCVHDWVDCRGSVVHEPSCRYDKDEAGMYIIMLGGTGKGWSGAEYTISSGSGAGEVQAVGTLEDGETGFGSVCLSEGCYSLHVSNGKVPDAVLWMFCGAIGQAGTVSYFEVVDGTCRMMSSLFLCRIIFLVGKYLTTIILMASIAFLLCCGCCAVAGVLLVRCLARSARSRRQGFRRLHGDNLQRGDSLFVGEPFSDDQDPTSLSEIEVMEYSNIIGSNEAFTAEAAAWHRDSPQSS